MALSAVKIANMALSHVGSANTIESFNENSVEAIQCNLWYDNAKEEALSALDWAFARKRQVLAAHTNDAPLNEWSYRFQYPADALVIRRLENPVGKTADQVPFDTEIADNGTRSIVTDLQTPTAVYTANITQTSLFTPFFVSALSYNLASYIAPTLTRSQKLADALKGRFKAILRVGQAIIANEARMEAPRDAEWIRARD